VPGGVTVDLVRARRLVALHPAARKLLDRLRSPAGQAIFRAHGFDAPPK